MDPNLTGLIGRPPLPNDVPSDVDMETFALADAPERGPCLDISALSNYHPSELICLSGGNLTIPFICNLMGTIPTFICRIHYHFRDIMDTGEQKGPN